MLENVRPDGSFNFDVMDGRTHNPGHAIEAGWFLLDHARKTGACVRGAGEDAA
jgi:N-acylglucosamine 2-epimerase